MTGQTDATQTRRKRRLLERLNWRRLIWRDPDRQPRRHRCLLCGQRTALPGVCELCQRELGSGE